MPELELVAVAVEDKKKGEKIVLLVTENIDLNTIKSALLKDEVPPLMMPSKVILVDEMPKLGTGKTDFSASKKIAQVHIS